jgi:membrane protein DedA with SNARE-associated domain
VVAVIAIPLAPFLYREHAVVLVLLRPTKEVFLLMGFLAKEGDVGLGAVVVSALPVLVGGVWLFYGLGRGFREEIGRAELPGPLGRLLPPKRIRRLGEAVDDGGPRLVFLGRFAAFPSSLVAAAAGAGAMEAAPFLWADGLGALASMSAALGAGFVLGEAYDEAGPWLTAVGVVALAAMATALGRRLQATGAADHH